MHSHANPRDGQAPQGIPFGHGWRPLTPDCRTHIPSGYRFRLYPKSSWSSNRFYYAGWAVSDSSIMPKSKKIAITTTSSGGWSERPAKISRSINSTAGSLLTKRPFLNRCPRRSCATTSSNSAKFITHSEQHGRKEEGKVDDEFPRPERSSRCLGGQRRGGFRPHNRHPTTAKACVGAPGPYLPENLAQVDQCQKVCRSAVGSLSKPRPVHQSPEHHTWSSMDQPGLGSLTECRRRWDFPQF